MIAGVDVAVVLDDKRAAALLCVDADGRRVSDPGIEGPLEIHDEDLAHVTADPLLEDADEKIAPGLGLHGPGCDLPLPFHAVQRRRGSKAKSESCTSGGRSWTPRARKNSTGKHVTANVERGQVHFILRHVRHRYAARQADPRDRGSGPECCPGGLRGVPDARQSDGRPDDLHRPDHRPLGPQRHDGPSGAVRPVFLSTRFLSER